MIDLDMLQQDGLLKKKDYRNLNWGDDPEHVDYARIYELRFRVLRIAFNNAQKGRLTDFNNFVRKNSAWLENYALYMAVKKSFGMRAWTEWEDEGIRLRDPDSVRAYRRNLDEDVRFYNSFSICSISNGRSSRLRQFSGHQALWRYSDLCRHGQRGHLGQPEVFWLDEAPSVRVAGCPPDYFSTTGQLWGNPLYDWGVPQSYRLQVVGSTASRRLPALRRDPHRPPRL